MAARVLRNQGCVQRNVGFSKIHASRHVCLNRVIHQVSGTHTRMLCKTLGLAPEKVLAIYPEFGNIGPASVAIALSKAAEAGRLKKGARIGMMGIGSGLNCAMAEVVW